jgi:DMSO/TMAO reductase YedYZ heme-binding membrane subunit
LWILLLVVYFFVDIKSFGSYWKKWKNLRYLFFTLLATSLFFSYIQDKALYDMFVGFKYGFYYLFIFLSATFLGHGLVQQ